MKKYLLYLMLIIGASFLLNNEVNALTISNQFDTVFDEEYIYNKFSEDESFDINTYPYILCSWGTVNTYYRGLQCRAFTEESYNNLYLDSYTSYGLYSLQFPKIGSEYGEVCSFEFYQNINTGSVYKDYVSCSGESFGWGLYIDGNNSTDSSTGKAYSNFNILTYDSDVTESTFNNFNTAINKLDFSEYETKLTFDENLFTNNENFKEVCVDSNKIFSITKDTLHADSFETDYDFIWFPYNVEGLYMSEYTSEDSEDNIRIFNDDIATEHFWFNSIENIDNIYNDELNSNYFLHKGYEDKYLYYGYSAYKFSYWYNYVDGNNLNVFSIFEFKNPYKQYIDNREILPGVGSSSLIIDKEINIDNQYCFYVKKEYVVQYLYENEFGDYFGTVVTPNGDLDITTSYNEKNHDYSANFSMIEEFIYEMGDTVNFIKEALYNFYIEMPLLLRMFIIVAFNLILLKIIIGMVVK